VEDSGTAWIGTYGSGLERFNPATEQFSHYRNDAEDANSLGDNFVLAVLRTKDGRLWVGTEAGLDVFDEDSGRFIHYVHNNSDPQSMAGGMATRLFEDSKGNLWVGTNQGLDRFDPENETFSHYVALNDPTATTRDRITTVEEDRQGFIWVGTFNKGLYRLDTTFLAYSFYQNNPSKADSLSNNSVTAIFQDGSARIWVATAGGGLNLFDPVSDTFSAIVEKDGLPSGVVYSILQDKHGYLWLSTNNGIARLDPAERTFKNYNLSNGLQSNEFSLGAYAQGRTEPFIWAGLMVIQHFYPLQMRENAYVPQVRITSLTWDGNPIPVVRQAGQLPQITLRYPQNSFDFEFTALSFSQPEKTNLHTC